MRAALEAARVSFGFLFYVKSFSYAGSMREGVGQKLSNPQLKFR